jgi:hypothetical protein
MWIESSKAFDDSCWRKIIKGIRFNHTHHHVVGGIIILCGALSVLALVGSYRRPDMLEGANT